MSESLKLEENANTYLKKLSNLLENLTSNLSKDKTEKAFEEGNEYIQEIENLIELMEKSKEYRYINNDVIMMKIELAKKKLNLEKIEKSYIFNKSNQLIESASTNISQINRNNNIDVSQEDEYNIYDKSIFDDEDDEKYEKYFIEEESNENIKNNELSKKYLYNQDLKSKIKRNIQNSIAKVNQKLKQISPKNKYLIILIILIISLIICLICLYFSYNNSIK